MRASCTMSYTVLTLWQLLLRLDANGPDFAAKIILSFMIHVSYTLFPDGQKKWHYKKVMTRAHVCMLLA